MLEIRGPPGSSQVFTGLHRSSCVAPGHQHVVVEPALNERLEEHYEPQLRLYGSWPKIKHNNNNNNNCSPKPGVYQSFYVYVFPPLPSSNHTSCPHFLVVFVHYGLPQRRTLRKNIRTRSYSASDDGDLA